MFVALGIKGNLGPLHRAMIDLRAKQVPFAMSLALNDLAKGVRGVEIDELDATFDSPTPFTENAYRIEVATKARPIAIVAAKDIQAEYLEPYVVGGPRSLGNKRGMLAPRNVALNKYGNLTRGKIASLRGKPNVFIGPVKTRSGKVINGVWQRPGRGARRDGSSGTKGRTGLKLLIQFEDTTEAPKRLPFEQVARQYIDRNARPAFEAALRRAIATARR
jgi:hypothetical protein